MGNVMLVGCIDPEDAKRAFVAAADCVGEREGAYEVTVTDRVSGKTWAYKVRKLATRIVVHCPGERA